MRSFRRTLTAVAAGALALRVAWIAAGDWSPERLIGDAAFYHEVALLVARGDGFANPELPGLPTAGHPPLHPLLLALPSALGLTSWTAHRLVGAVVGTVAVVLIGLLGRRVGGERAGIAAASLAAIYPTFVRTDGAVLSESLYGVIVAACLLAAYELRDRPRARVAAALGALVGAAALTRAEAVLLLFLLALPLALRGGGRQGLRVVAVCAAFGLVVAPWLARNAAAFDRFVPISTNSGTAIAGANCAQTYSGFDLGLWRFECLDLGPRASRNDAVQGDRLREKGLRYARDHAARVPLVAAVRALRAWSLYQPWRQAALSEGRHVTLARAGVVAFYLVAALGAYGMVVLRRRAEPLFILVTPFILVTVTAALTLGLPRFRHAAEISLLVLAGMAVAHLTRRRTP